MIVDLIIAAVAMLACFLAVPAGQGGQGTVFGIIAIGTLLAPRRRSAIGVIAIMLLACAAARLGAMAWLQCAAVIVAYIAALSSLRQTTGYATTVILGLLWLTAPIWLPGQLMANLARFHPLLAINGATLASGIWTERPLMYQWTALGQDVPYSLPTTVIWCVGAHLIVAALLIAIRHPYHGRLARVRDPGK